MKKKKARAILDFIKWMRTLNDEELAYVISVGSAFDRKMVCSHCKIHEEGFTCTDNDCMNGVKRWLSEDDCL